MSVLGPSCVCGLSQVRVIIVAGIGSISQSDGSGCPVNDCRCEFGRTTSTEDPTEGLCLQGCYCAMVGHVAVGCKPTDPTGECVLNRPAVLLLLGFVSGCGVKQMYPGPELPDEKP